MWRVGGRRHRLKSYGDEGSTEGVVAEIVGGKMRTQVKGMEMKGTQRKEFVVKTVVVGMKGTRKKGV